MISTLLHLWYDVTLKSRHLIEFVFQIRFLFWSIPTQLEYVETGIYSHPLNFWAIVSYKTSRGQNLNTIRSATPLWYKKILLSDLLRK